ncbi:hypothetical protein FCM35_KLT14561 [Carex littledalei]|uniref:Uncharacterized protein n=1 Tax=Carex littledalei TaxID=544730 RepID=A0A833QJX1_9POAL|nr:hypothetical protein FCM35_KLT14561 [Carex littledalei]
MESDSLTGEEHNLRYLLREEGVELELELERRWGRGASEEEERSATCPILVFSVLTAEANLLSLDVI